MRERPDLTAACQFLEETGLRVAELCSIEREAAYSWPVPGKIRNRHPRATIHVVGKGNKERTIVLTPRALRAADVLANYPRKMPQNGDRSGLLPWSDRGLRWLLAKYGARAGVPAWPHRFRHTYCTQLVEAGVPMEVVADMMGHTSMETTRLYFLLSERTKREAMRRRRRYLRRGR